MKALLVAEAASLLWLQVHDLVLGFARSRWETTDLRRAHCRFTSRLIGRPLVPMTAKSPAAATELDW